MGISVATTGILIVIPFKYIRMIHKISTEGKELRAIAAVKEPTEGSPPVSRDQSKFSVRQLDLTLTTMGEEEVWGGVAA